MNVSISAINCDELESTDLIITAEIISKYGVLICKNMRMHLVVPFTEKHIDVTHCYLKDDDQMFRFRLMLEEEYKKTCEPIADHAYEVMKDDAS